MDLCELRAEMARQQISIPKLANLIGINKKQLYARFSEKVAFKQNEIQKIKNVLNLSDEKMITIFFSQNVS